MAAQSQASAASAKRPASSSSRASSITSATETSGPMPSSSFSSVAAAVVWDMDSFLSGCVGALCSAALSMQLVNGGIQTFLPERTDNTGFH